MPEMFGYAPRGGGQPSYNPSRYGGSSYGPSTLPGYTGPGTGQDPLRPYSLEQLVASYFLPELQRTRELGGPIEGAFMQQALQPGALYGAASTAAGGVARQLFAPGGEVAGLVRGARGSVIGQGFDPSSAEGAERGIMQSATNRVADTFATQAGQLEGLRFGALTQAFGGAQQGTRDILESIMSGEGMAHSYDLARRQRQGPFGLW